MKKLIRIIIAIVIVMVGGLPTEGLTARNEVSTVRWPADRPRHYYTSEPPALRPMAARKSVRVVSKSPSQSKAPPELKERVQEKMVFLLRLQNSCETPEGLNRERIAKKRRWVKEHKNDPWFRWEYPKEDLMDYILRVFYFECVEIEKAEMEIIEKTPTKLHIKSITNCPFLAACIELQLDTRTICKGILHDEYQAVLDEIARSLNLKGHFKFERNYSNGLRPYQEYCEEIITYIPTDVSEAVRQSVHSASTKMSAEALVAIGTAA